MSSTYRARFDVAGTVVGSAVNVLDGLASAWLDDYRCSTREGLGWTRAGTADRGPWGMTVEVSGTE